MALLVEPLEQLVKYTFGTEIRVLYVDVSNPTAGDETC